MGATASTAKGGVKPLSAEVQVEVLRQQISQLQNDLKNCKQQIAQLQDNLESCNKQNARLQRALQSGIPHMAEATSALKKAIGQIESSVLSGTSVEEDLVKMDESLMSIARGFLRRNEEYLTKVFEKHSVRADTGDTLLRKESLRAALKDAQFPSVISALAINDEDLFHQVDVDASGQVSFDEFRQFVLQCGSVETWMHSEHFVKILSESVVPLLEVSAKSEANLAVVAQDDLMRELATLSPDQFQRALDVAAIGLNMQFELSQQALNRRLKALTEQTERLSQSKFEVSKLACGSIDDFHKGLESRIGISHNYAVQSWSSFDSSTGTPGLDFEKEMYEEHCRKFGCDLKFITNNYKITTTVFKEWMYAIGDKERQVECPDEQIQRDKDGKPVRTIDNIQMYLKMVEAKDKGLGFEPSENLDHEQRALQLRLFDTIQAANLRKAEIFAIILYTGPNFLIYNTILRRYPTARYKVFCNGITCRNCHQACNVQDKFHREPRCSECSNSKWLKKEPYTASECIQCVNTSCLSGYLLCPTCVMDLDDKVTGEGNLFTTTIFSLVSAIQKLSRTMVIPPGTLLYRGMGGSMDMPVCFYETDKHGCSGYCEFAFMSTTACRNEAISYSGLGKKEKPKAVIMVIHPNSVDRGACISDFSQ
jgi:cob(I)alamin adenosyltransferase